LIQKKLRFIVILKKINIMLSKIHIIPALKDKISTAFLSEKPDISAAGFLSEDEKHYLRKKMDSGTECSVYKHPVLYFFAGTENKKQPSSRHESARCAGSKFYELLKEEKINSVQIKDDSLYPFTLSFLEGFLLSSYTFSRYKKEKEDYIPAEISLVSDHITEAQISELQNLVQAVFYTRNLVNEPLSWLTATCFSEEMERLGNEAGFSVEILNRKKIEALRMGGLLAVNKGSIDPPTFTIMEWKPDVPVNEKPVVLVGKGVVYDTGGLSLKPTPKSMDYMKSDMAGGAVVAAVLYAIAKNRLPVHVIGLVPATDNRPDGNAYVPGDIITMFDGTTVEIRNTDAEGRLLLADALSYARKYDPMLVVDVATLTGSAEIITGPHAMAAMGNNPEFLMKMKQAGDETFERMVELPLWEEYAKPLKSNVADLNNLGIREGQTSIAGKFLEHFTSYPWLHLDIAGVAYYHEKEGYRPAGGTGFGTRLLYHFLKLFN
jgi:leucyl aminopeptidase